MDQKIKGVFKPSTQKLEPQNTSTKPSAWIPGTIKFMLKMSGLPVKKSK